MADETEQDDAPGWDAIDAALRPLYGDREPLHFGCVVPHALGGPDPIHGISVYRNVEPRPHWHYVTYGFSELWAKESDDPEVSGFGFELTFRLARPPRQRTPPPWAWSFLQNLGRYVFETGNRFGVGHTMPLNGPIEQGAETLIHAVTFAADPRLPPLATPNGRVEFLQVVGLTTDEVQAISSWNAAAFLELRRLDDPALLTDLARASWLDDAAFAAEVARLSERDGSSCGWMSLFLECDAAGDPVRVRVQSIAADGLRRRLLSRLPYGRTLTLRGSDTAVVFAPGRRSRLTRSADGVTVTLKADHLAALAESLRPQAGTYPVPGVKGVVLEVLRTEITDRDGDVVDVVE